MRHGLTRILTFTAATAVLVAAMPTFATAADKFTQVVVRNTVDDPVVTRSTGTTQVAGAVSLAEGTRVGLSDGSTVELAEGTVVQLADGSGVGITNTADAPVPVELVGGADRARWTAASGFTFLEDDQVTAVSPIFYTVPAGASLVVTTATGYTSPDVGTMSLYGDCPGAPAMVHGVFDGTDSFGFKAWHTTGEAGFGPGCTLQIHATHATGGAKDSAKMHINGYLTPAG